MCENHFLCDANFFSNVTIMCLLISYIKFLGPYNNNVRSIILKFYKNDGNKCDASISLSIILHIKVILKNNSIY